ncbi:MAG: asparagine synthase-related protein [Cyanobacteriota bacterium]
MKLNNSQGKCLGFNFCRNYVPRNLIDHLKGSFGIPIESWLRGSLRDLAEELQWEVIFSSQPIRHKWKEHIVGDPQWQYYLWDVLICQTWLNEKQNA